MTAALCRELDAVGIALLKGQNMSNNAWVDADGGEMAYSQAMQAQANWSLAAMNPVLLKPRGDGTSEVIRSGSVGAAPRALLPRWFRPGWQAIRAGCGPQRSGPKAGWLEGQTLWK